MSSRHQGREEEQGTLRAYTMMRRPANYRPASHYSSPVLLLYAFLSVILQIEVVTPFSIGLTYLKNTKLILYFQRHQALKWLTTMVLFLIYETKAIRVSVSGVEKEVKMIPTHSLGYPSR